MNNHFISLLRYYIDDFGTREELADELNASWEKYFNTLNNTRGRKPKHDKLKNFSRFTISKHLSESQLISQQEFACYLMTLNIKEEDRELLKELFPVYQSWYRMGKEKQETVTKIGNVFKAFQDLSVLCNSPKVSQNYDIPPQSTDGIYSDSSERTSVIKCELIREFCKSEPKMDVFLPQNLDCYYNQIKQFFEGDNSDKTIQFRQILTFPKRKEKKVFIEGFDLLEFLPTVYYLLYSSNSSYEFFYSYSDTKIQDIDALIYPYYICTSDCLIRLSQHCRSIWISHNPDDIHIYHKRFQDRLNHKAIKPLVNKYKFLIDVIDDFSTSSLYCHLFYCPDCHLPSLITKEIFDRGINSSLPLHSKDIIYNYCEYCQQSNYEVQGCTYFNRHNLLNFAENGIIREYPKELTVPFSPEDRIRILEKLYQIIQTPEKYSFHYYIAQSKNFNTNDNFIVCTSKSSIVTYLVGMPNFEFCFISESSVVEDFKYYFKEYLPHSDMIYPKEKALEIVEQAIEIAKSQLRK